MVESVANLNFLSNLKDKEQFEVFRDNGVNFITKNSNNNLLYLYILNETGRDPNVVRGLVKAGNNVNHQNSK